MSAGQETPMRQRASNDTSSLGSLSRRFMEFVETRVDGVIDLNETAQRLNVRHLRPVISTRSVGAGTQATCLRYYKRFGRCRFAGEDFEEQCEMDAAVAHGCVRARKKSRGAAKAHSPSRSERRVIRLSHASIYANRNRCESWTKRSWAFTRIYEH